MVTLSFHSTIRSTSDTTIQAYVNDFNEIFIEISSDDYPTNYVCLDKQTAIRFCKELRKQISLLESEVDNGNI